MTSSRTTTSIYVAARIRVLNCCGNALGYAQKCLLANLPTTSPNDFLGAVKMKKFALKSCQPGRNRGSDWHAAQSLCIYQEFGIQFFLKSAVDLYILINEIEDTMKNFDNCQRFFLNIYYPTLQRFEKFNLVRRAL